MGSRKTIILILTNTCNLKCSYCYEHHKTMRRMSLSVAKSIIDKEFTAEDGTEQIKLEFFGGEPFIEFELIKEIYAYIECNYWTKEWHCYATTNGTLIHDEVQQWLIERKHSFTVGLSYDGTTLMQDTNRSNSSKQIDLDFFLRTYPNQTLKMTVSPATLLSLADGVIYLHEMGFSLVANLAYGDNWDYPGFLENFSAQLDRLTEYYLENPGRKIVSFLDMDVTYKNRDPDFFHKQCGAGTAMFAYETNGDCYPCQFFASVSIGESSEKYKNIRFSDKYNKEVLSDRCRECVIRDSCVTCMGTNFCEMGNMFLKSDSHCRIMKMQFLASSYLKYKLWQKGNLNLCPEDEYALLIGIESIQSSLG